MTFAKKLLTVLIAALARQVASQQTYATSETVEDDEGGLGMAEIIAIVVCILIVLAFILVCFIMVRNANKRKDMKEEADNRKKARGVDQTGDMTANESFAVTRQIKNNPKLKPDQESSSEEDSDEEEESESEVSESEEAD